MDSTIAPRARVILKMPSKIPTGRASVLLTPSLQPLRPAPSVSVLITSYKDGRFLGQAIESALSQSYPPKEVIVSSSRKDNSCDVAEGYMRPGAPVTLLRCKHQGMASSLNAAFRASVGDIVCLLDANDYFLPGKIEAVVSAFRSEPEAGLAVHRAQMVDKRDRQRGVFPLLRSLPRGNCLQAMLHNSGVLMGLPPTSNLSLRREIAYSIFPIPECFTGYAEQMIHRIAPLMTSICAIERPLSVWRLDGREVGNPVYLVAERLEREIGYMRDLWFQQRDYLLLRSPELAKHMPALESNVFYMRMRYMQLKLLGDPTARECHTALCALSEPKGSPVDFFWRHSLHLPRPLFRKCIDLLQAESIWKEWVAWAVRRRQAW